MVEGFSKITHKGKTLFYHDYSGFAKDKATQKEKTIKLRKAVTAEYTNQPPLSVLTLVNVENFYFDMDVLKAFKEEVAIEDKYERKSAIIGVKGLVKTAYNFVVGFASTKVKLFDSLEEAKDWLVKD